MSKITWKPGTFLAPLPVVLVSCGTMKESNVFTVAWNGIVNTAPPMVSISVRPTRHSYKMIMEQKEFVINLTTKNLVRAVDWCGVNSGRDFDKFKKMNLHKEKASVVKCPMIEESPVSVECKVVDTKEFGSHMMIIAEVVAVNADERYIDHKGKFHITKCDLIAYANGNYMSLGKKLGYFGFSVRKKKKDKR